MKTTSKAVCLILALSLLFLTACGSNAVTSAEEVTSEETLSAVTEGSDGAYTFTDDLGREVTVAGSPQRVAAMIGSYADIWALAGGKDTIVAAANDTWTAFELDLDEDVVNIGSHVEPSLEELLGTEPDFILASSNTEADMELLDTFEEAGLTAAYFEVETFDDYLRVLEICCNLTGHPENYETYGTAQQAQVDAAIAKADGSQPTALYIRASGSSVKVKNNEDSVLGEMLADLDCVNIADRDDALLENLSLEAIQADDPDYIFVVYQGVESRDKAEALVEETLLSNPAWNTLRAVEEGNYYVLDSHLYNSKPNDEYGVAYEQLADILYGGK